MKEYKFLYLTKFFFDFANSFIDIFGVVMLYKNGMPIYMILLVYGLRFGIMGISSPLFLKISSKYGIASCALIANILRILGTYMILEGTYNNLFVFIFTMSIPGALSNPIEDAVSSKYVEKTYRGRYNSYRKIAKILGQALASITVAWGVENNHSLLMTIITMAFLLDYLCTAFVDYKPELKNKNALKDTLQFIIKQKSDYKIVYALRTNHIIERIFLPLYLYLVLQDFVLFTKVITLSLFIQIITVIIIGKFTDKDIRKSNHIVSTIRVFITATFLLIKNKIVVSLNKTLNDNFEKVYETSVQSSIQNMMKESKEDETLLSTIGQMSLCFTELVILSILAFISIWIQEKIFIIIFLLSILSTIGINKKLSHD